MQPATSPLLATALSSAFTASRAFIRWSAVAQPTTRREAMSITVAIPWNL
jgi:hypothetical protein